MEKFKFISKDKISKLPKTSGVYCFKNKDILYIGKAINIKNRVKNHFQQPSFRDNLFTGNASKIGYLKTDSEIEALVLEANLIKKYQPKYNVLWRDDKNYFYVSVTQEDFPKISITHQKKARDIFIGPFVDGNALKQSLKLLRKVFPFRSCNSLPKHQCLWYQLNRCPAPCLTKSALAGQLPSFKEEMEKECQRNARNLIKILQGKKKRVLSDLKKEMKKLSLHQNFEKAVRVRDQIKSLEKVFSHASILEQKPEINEAGIILQKILKAGKDMSHIEAYDVSNIQGQTATGSMVTFINGSPSKNLYRKFKIKISGKPDDTAMIKEILSRRFNHPEWSYPDLILVDGGKAQLNAARKSIKKLKIPIIALAKKNNELFVEGQKNPLLLKNL
ncbi:MAG: UvrB/UvrC motif-containing protein, partial [Candidatus Paceibacterota bacterium]